MKQKGIALAVTACFTLSAAGCSMPSLPFGETESSAASSAAASEPEKTTTVKAERFDVDGLKQEIEALQEIWTKPDLEDEIAERIAALLRADDEAYALNVRAEMAYYADWSNAALYEKNADCYEDYYVVDEMLTWAFANGYTYSAYGDLFRPYIDPDWVYYYTSNTLARVMSYARSDASDNAELLDEYYDTYSDADADPSESNAACAELYLETLRSYNSSDFFYSQYNRDYTVEQASEAAASVLEYLVPVYDRLYEEISMHPLYESYLNGNTFELDAYETLRQYAPRISDSVAESVDKLFDEELYYKASGDDCYDGSYTVPLTNEHAALIYTYLYGDYYDLITVSHEFGHFHADWRDTTPIYLQKNCTDIAEAQSQGMEMLFTDFYDEIYGDEAVFLEMLALYNTVSSVVSGFGVGSFEYQVMLNQEKYTAADVLDCYHTYSEEYDLGLELYEISHLYEQPGYYISYGVSALPALQLYSIMQDDPEKAKEIYGQICDISSMSGEYHFCSAMQQCGLENPFAEESIQRIAETLNERITELAER